MENYNLENILKAFFLLTHISGLNPSIIGAFSGMAALMGFGATFLSAALVRRVGVLRVCSLFEILFVKPINLKRSKNFMKGDLS